MYACFTLNIYDLHEICYTWYTWYIWYTSNIMAVKSEHVPC